MEISREPSGDLTGNWLSMYAKIMPMPLAPETAPFWAVLLWDTSLAARKNGSKPSQVTVNMLYSFIVLTSSRSL